MNLFKEVLAHEVYPAFGCTEPISCAYAAATAAAQLGEPVESLLLRVDPGTYKNGAAVTVPHSNGGKGNLIAAALGAALAKPDAKLELLQHVSDDIRARAQAMCDAGRCQSECFAEWNGFYIEVVVHSASHHARCVLAGGHTNVAIIEKDGQTILRNDSASPKDPLAYRLDLKRLDVAEVLALAKMLDSDDRDYLQRGVEMNLAIAEWGYEVGGMARQLQQMRRDGFLADDMFYRVKLRVASAVDARMTGMSRAVMTSGGAGNQGIVAILTPYLVGREMDVDLDRIIESLAIAHLINAYVKCFVGEISAICGCAMAAGIGSAAAIVYQQKGSDLERIGMAVGNVVGDLCGLLCDGAKPGCAMKAVSAVDSALRSALMALRGYGLSHNEGMTGHTIEDSLQNLGRMARVGMRRVDPTMLHILQEKAAGCGS
jgi:L-cysteine desulfidase